MQHFLKTPDLNVIWCLIRWILKTAAFTLHDEHFSIWWRLVKICIIMLRFQQSGATGRPPLCRIMEFIKEPQIFAEMAGGEDVHFRGWNTSGDESTFSLQPCCEPTIFQKTNTSPRSICGAKFSNNLQTNENRLTLHFRWNKNNIFSFTFNDCFGKKI